MMTRILTLSLVAGIAACGGESVEPVRTAADPSPSITVRAETLLIALPVEGSVEARRRSALSTRMMARVNSILVDVGDRVSVGQTLIRLGTADIAANRAKAEAAIAAAEAARDEAARQTARADTLYAEDALPRVHRDAARLALTQAESQLAMARASLAEVQNANRYAQISAPFDGAVVSRRINEGDVAAPGMPLMEVEATGAREAVFAVPADVAREIGTGSPIEVTAGEHWTATARVRAVSSGADPMTRTVEVRAELPADWPTGVSVTALVPIGTRVGIAIPSSALVRRGQLTGVRVITPHGALLRWVRLGRSVAPDPADPEKKRRVEILSGLEAGDRIVP